MYRFIRTTALVTASIAAIGISLVSDYGPVSIAFGVMGLLSLGLTLATRKA